jgi:putative peptidoglycan lipid II flippase
VLANALYAFQDTWTPVRSAAIALVMNALLNLILVWPMGLAGLALATSLSSTWNAFHLYRAVRRRVGPMASEWTGSVLRLAAASAGMGLLVQGMAAAGSGLAWLAVTVLAGLVSFFGLAILLRVEEIQKLRAWLFRRS